MAREKPKLTDAHRAFVVRELACYSTPEETAEAVRREFGIDITRQTCEYYDPTKFAGAKLAKKWQDLFWSARNEFNKTYAKTVAIANKSVRVKYLQEAAQHFRRQKAFTQMADMLERVAKEVGNVHTNRREFTGKDGGAIKTETKIENMTVEQLDSEILRLAGMDEVTEVADEKPTLQ